MAVAMAGFLGIGLFEAWNDSPTFDEPVYVASGLAAVLHHDLTINAEHPPLTKVLAVLPVLLAHPVVPGNGDWKGNDEQSYSAKFVQAQLRAGSLRRVTFLSRLVPLIETLALALLLRSLAAELFGVMAGTLAGVLWLASPFVIGLGHLDSVDMPFALSVAAWAWALMRWMTFPTRRRLFLVGLLAGVAALSEVTGLFLPVIGAGVVVVARWRLSPRRAIGEAAVVGGVAWVAIWACYTALDPGLLARPRVLPEPYLDGLRYLARNDTVPGPGYVLGHSWTGANWWYWPISMVAKTVPTTLLLLVVGLVGYVWVEPVIRRRVLVALGLPAVCLLAFNLWTPRDVGLRSLLPVIALWLVAATAVVRIPLPSRAARAVSGAVATTVVVVGALATATSAPNSLAWTTPPLQPAYRVVANSDVDWGQDLYSLQAWSKSHHPLVAYFGPRGLVTSDIPDARSLLGTAPDRVRGWVAVSASALTQADRKQLGWLRAYCPVGNLGGSILLYRFISSPSSAPGPTTPAGECLGGAASVRT